MTGSVVAILNTSSQVALILHTHIDQLIGVHKFQMILQQKEHSINVVKQSMYIHTYTHACICIQSTK